ncbi:recombinase RecT [Microtetraspora fusca]|uniref:Recombinase RecT n=1 Tax=Microtetraspora fusca TaxID=1997 RepID=A0ABW6VDX0_MICFU
MTADHASPVQTREPNAPIPDDEGIERTESAVAFTPASGGVLVFRRDQGIGDMTARQLEAFKGIVNFDPMDRQAWPHMEVFIEACTSRGLNPFLRQIYLIKRGDGDNASFTIQTGIDGFRILANDTGRIKGGATIYWTGDDDDDSSWRAVEDPRTGELVMRRIWWEQWPDIRDHPGAAKAVLEHYDPYGNDAVTTAIANWKMYAPYFPAKGEWKQTKNDKWYREKVYNPDGSIAMELSEMWEKGQALMPGKCAEALVLRKACPERLSGIYTNEEMMQADATAAREQIADGVRARQDKYRSAVTAVQVPSMRTRTSPAPDTTTETTAEVTVEVAPDDVQEAGQDATPDGASEQTPTADELAQWMRDEIAMISEAIGKPYGNIVVRQLRKNLDDATAAEMVAIVGPMRDAVADLLAKSGRAEEAQAYREAGRMLIAPVPVLLGRVAAEAEAEAEGSPLHLFVEGEDGAECAAPGCGRPAEDATHVS